LVAVENGENVWARFFFLQLRVPGAAKVSPAVFKLVKEEVITSKL